MFDTIVAVHPQSAYIVRQDNPTIVERATYLPIEYQYYDEFVQLQNGNFMNFARLHLGNCYNFFYSKENSFQENSLKFQIHFQKWLFFSGKRRRFGVFLALHFHAIIVFFVLDFDKEVETHGLNKSFCRLLCGL